MEIYTRDLHNDMIKPFDNGLMESLVDSVTHKILISDTTLRSCITPQVRKKLLNYLIYMDVSLASF